MQEQRRVFRLHAQGLNTLGPDNFTEQLLFHHLNQNREAPAAAAGALMWAWQSMIIC